MTYYYVLNHGKHNAKCKECKGSDICDHNRIRSQCRDCNGSHFVAMVNINLIALIAVVLKYATRTDHHIIQDAEQEETEDWTCSVLTVLLIYCPMILGP